MIDKRVDPLVEKAHRLVSAMEDNNDLVVFECDRQIRRERFKITAICLTINLFIIILSFFI